MLVDGSEAVGHPVTAAEAARLLEYLDAVLELNRQINLTGVRDRADAVVRHLLDSLSVAAAWHALAGAEPPATLLDLGTGGGFPGAPLAIVWPGTRALLLDRTGKKAAAVTECLERVGVGNAQAFQATGSQLHALRPETRGTFELCVARAVGRAAPVLDELRRLPAPGGRIFLMKGPEPPDDEVKDAGREARRLGFTVEPPLTTSVPGLLHRKLLVYTRT